MKTFNNIATNELPLIGVSIAQIATWIVQLTIAAIAIFVILPVAWVSMHDNPQGVALTVSEARLAEDAAQRYFGVAFPVRNVDGSLSSRPGFYAGCDRVDVGAKGTVMCRGSVVDTSGEMVDQRVACDYSPQMMRCTRMDGAEDPLLVSKP